MERKNHMASLKALLFQHGAVLISCLDALFAGAPPRVYV